MTARHEFPFDLEWLKGACESLAFGPTTYQLLHPYVTEIERLQSSLTAAGDDVTGLLAGIRALLSVTEHGSNSGPVFEARKVAYRALAGRGAIEGETK